MKKQKKGAKKMKVLRSSGVPQNGSNSNSDVTPEHKEMGVWKQLTVDTPPLKLHICLETVDSVGDHWYMIYSLELAELTTTTPLSHHPALFLESQFKGYPSMGCGFFDSKIVFAGGKLSNDDGDDKVLHNGFITFDMNSKKLSYDPYPLMDHGKLKPFVFQLQNNLYVLSTKSGYLNGAFEYYNSAKQEWHNLRTPLDIDRLTWCRFPPVHPYGHPIVVIGSVCYLTIPEVNCVFHHHPNLTYRSWRPVRSEPLPFSGVATYYNQAGFDDVFVISFTDGRVEAHRLDLDGSCFKGNQLLFQIFPSESDTQMCGYFADFGDGIYCLTAFDNDFLYVCAFQVEIAMVEIDEEQPELSSIFCDVYPFTTLEEVAKVQAKLKAKVPAKVPTKVQKLELSCSVYTTYKYPVNVLCHVSDILGVVGCFAPSPNLPAKERAEKTIDQRYECYGRRYDDNPRLVEFKGNKYPVHKNHKDGMVQRLPIRKQDGYYV